MARPTDYTDQLATRICAELAVGKSLRTILKEDDMPSMSTVFNWLADKTKPEFLEQYARAKEEAADALADDIQDISDKVLQKVYDPASARVAMDGKKWIAAKLKPKRYGDKLDLDANISGNITINTVDYKDADVNDSL